jgi:hypothetical protein
MGVYIYIMAFPLSGFTPIFFYWAFSLFTVVDDSDRGSSCFKILLPYVLQTTCLVIPLLSILRPSV